MIPSDSQCSQRRKRPSEYPTDPVGYATEILGVSLAEVQKEIARHTLIPPCIVNVPSGNNWGKCVAESEFLTLADGRRVRAGDLVGKTFNVLTLDASGKIISTGASAYWNATEPVWELTTEAGRRIVRNSMHPLWVGDIRRINGKSPLVRSSGWKNLASIKVGDHVAVAESLPAFGNEPMPEEDLRLLAYMIGDGGMTQSSLTFAQLENSTLERFRKAATAKGVVLVKTPYGNCNYRVVGKSEDRSRRKVNKNGRVTHHRVNLLGDLLSKHGLDHKHSRQKFIPSVIWNLPQEQQCLFLSCLYSTDGWATADVSGGLEIGYCSTSERLVREVQEMLLRFGIRACIRFRANVNAWCADIHTSEDLVRFAEMVGIEDKVDAVEKVREKASTKGSRSGWRKADAFPGTSWERVSSVKMIGEAKTVAIEVPWYHTYLTQFYEHNTYLASVLISWWFDNFNPSAVYTLAPTKNHIVTVLWAQLRVLRRKAGLESSFIGPKAPEMYDGPDHFAIGLTASTGEGFRGRHIGRKLFIFDEATDRHISPYLDELPTMFDPMAGDAAVYLYNPTDTTSRMYALDQAGVMDGESTDGTKMFHRFRLSVLEHPNIVPGLRGERLPIPGAVNPAMVSKMVKDSCDPVKEADKTALDFFWPVDEACPCCNGKGQIE